MAKQLLFDFGTTGNATDDHATCPEVEIMLYWNGNCGNLPKVHKLGKMRRVHLHTRWADPFFREHWKTAIRLLADSPFCNGVNDRGWRAGFDFLIRSEDTFVKIVEGNYNRAGPVSGQPHAKPGKWSGVPILKQDGGYRST